MAETYSLSITGRPVDEANTTSKLVKVGDSAAPDGVHDNAFMHNTQILCKNPDGSQSWYTLDAELSTASNIVLRAV